MTLAGIQFKDEQVNVYSLKILSFTDKQSIKLSSIDKTQSNYHLLTSNQLNYVIC